MARNAVVLLFLLAIQAIGLSAACYKFGRDAFAACLDEAQEAYVNNAADCARDYGKGTAEEFDEDITWGGIWDRSLLKFQDEFCPKQAVSDYAKRLGRTPFLDGPHYQRNWGSAPKMDFDSLWGAKRDVIKRHGLAP